MGITNLGNFSDITGQNNVFSGNNTFTGTNTFTTSTNFSGVQTFDGLQDFVGVANFSNQINVLAPIYSDNPVTLSYLQNTANCKFASQTCVANVTDFPDFSFNQVVPDLTKYVSDGMLASYDDLTGTWTLAKNRVYAINCSLLFQSESSYGFTSAVAIGIYFDTGSGWVFPLSSFDGYSWPYSATSSNFMQPSAFATFATGELENVKMGVFVELSIGINRLIGGDTTGTSNNRLLIQEYYQFN